MKDTYTSENGRDFRQRYSGTFGRYTTESGKKITVYVNELTDQEVLFNDINGVNLSARVNSGVEFEFYPLNRRLTDHNKTILYSCRKPDRQWKRGVCIDNTKIIDLARGMEIPVGHTVVDAIYNSQANFLDTFNQFKKGSRTNFLLSDKFAVVNGHVYLYDKPIGKFKNLEEVDVLPLFVQEVKDSIARNNLPLKVTLNDNY